MTNLHDLIDALRAGNKQAGMVAKDYALVA